MAKKDTISKQRKYLKEREGKSIGQGIILADTFLKGMRDIGYKSPAWALCEKLDNSFQGEASAVEICLKYASERKPEHIAVVDDGVGMLPAMITYAIMWGGTHRADNRDGFGRYGYGLPSSAVSLARKYTVYSKTLESEWQAVTFDIDEVCKVAGDTEKLEKLLRPSPRTLPDWVNKATTHIKLDKVESGTVVVLEDLDRLKTLGGWKEKKILVGKLLKHFGIVYRYWLPEKKVVVDGQIVQAIDPLFLFEHGRHFDDYKFLAKQVWTRKFKAETPAGREGEVRIRASIMPPAFTRIDPLKTSAGGRAVVKGNLNPRFRILNKHNGLIICREGRQIAVVQPKWTKLMPNDKYFKIEIDFDAELDEFFGITTAKQQIVIDDVMLEKLKQDGKQCGGLKNLITDLRKEFDALLEEDEAVLAAHRASEGESPRPSELAAEVLEEFVVKKKPTEAKEKKIEEESLKNLKDEAQEAAAAGGETEEEAFDRIEALTRERRYEVEFKAIPEGAFFRPKRVGEQKRIIINTEHPFFKTMWEPGPPGVQDHLEILLTCLAEHEFNAESEAETHAKLARQNWSRDLRVILEKTESDLQTRTDQQLREVEEEVEAIEKVEQAKATEDSTEDAP